MRGEQEEYERGARRMREKQKEYERKARRIKRNKKNMVKNKNLFLKKPIKEQEKNTRSEQQ